MKAAAEMCSELPQSSLDAIASLQSAVNLDQQGKEVFDSVATPFMQACRLMTEGLLAGGEDDAMIKAHSATAAGLCHKVLQACAWAETPIFTRGAVQLARDHLIPLCEAAKLLWRMKEGDAGSYQNTPRVIAASKVLADAEESSRELVYIIGEEVTGALQTEVRKYKDMLLTGHSKHVKELREKLSSKTKAFKDKLVEEKADKPIAMKELEPKLKRGTIELLKKSRGEAKEVIDLLQNAGVPEEEFKQDVDLVRLCKHQCFKWGIARFAAHAQICMMTQQGVDLRKSLKEVWDLESKDKDFMEYLGKEDQTTINEILALDTAQKKRKAAAADPTAEKAKATPPAKKKRGQKKSS